MTASRPSLRLSTPPTADVGSGLTLGLDFVLKQQQQQQQLQPQQKQQPNDTLVLNVCHSVDCVQHQMPHHSEYSHQPPQPFFITTHTMPMTTTSAASPTLPTPMLHHAYMPHKQLQQQQQHPAVPNTTWPKESKKSDSSSGKSSGNGSRCSRCPAPLFIILISLLEIAVFVYDYLTKDTKAFGHMPGDGMQHIPSDSVLMYRPDRRLQLWRFVSYMFLHANWFHLMFNVCVQTLYGLPLEWQHGSLRVAIVYVAGVSAGSLGTSVIDANVYLVGASGGVYALLAAQLANVLMNYGQMRYSLTQLMAVCIFVACDLGYALYTRYTGTPPLHAYSSVSPSAAAPTVSYIAHLTGALAGFTMALLLLKPYDGHGQSTLVWWLALSVYAAFTIFAIAFNLLNTMTAQLLEERGEQLGQHLLHDLGIS